MHMERRSARPQPGHGMRRPFVLLVGLLLLWLHVAAAQDNIPPRTLSIVDHPDEDATPLAPPLPSTPPQFSSVVVIGLNSQVPLSDNGRKSTLVTASQRLWSSIHEVQKGAGLSGNALPPTVLAQPLHQLRNYGPEWNFLAGQYYYNADSQKIRIDSTILGGFVSSYSYYVYGNQWIYMFMNTANSTCQKYALDKASFPDTNWLQGAQYIGREQVLGVDTYHWQGKGNHLGPHTNLDYYDYYVSVNDSTPVLISNSAFVQYFMTFQSTNLSQPLWNYPSMCAMS